MLEFKYTQDAINKGYHTRASIGDIVGLIPSFIHDNDPRSIQEQINERYSFGGGWNSFKGFSMNPETKEITYPDDPSYSPLVVAKYKDQEIYVYPYAWVAIVSKDGTFDICRID